MFNLSWLFQSFLFTYMYVYICKYMCVLFLRIRMKTTIWCSTLNLRCVCYCQIWIFCFTCFFLPDTANFWKKTLLGEEQLISFICSYLGPRCWLELFWLGEWYHTCPSQLPKLYSLATPWHSWWFVSILDESFHFFTFMQFSFLL